MAGQYAIETGRWPRECRCGRSHSVASWHDLSYVGKFVVGDSAIEMRECECGSTISVLRGEPLVSPSIASTARVRPYDPSTRPPHVLVVDDDPLVARALERGLSGSWQASVAESGEAMLTALRHGARFDVILLDVEMPGVDVRELLGRLAAIEASLVRRVVFMTGGPASDATRQFLSSIDNSWLKKPFPFGLLRDLLDVVHRQATEAQAS